MTTDLTALIAKLESATGPSRELDALIADAVMERVNMRMGEEEQDDGSWKPYYRLGYGLNRARWSHPPTFTASIDAALMLVPEGWEWLRKSNLTMTVYRVPSSDKEWAHHIDGSGCNSAVSLCIAALRARRSGEVQP